MERIKVYEQLRKTDFSKEPKESYAIYGFAAGSVTVEATTKTLLWCRWPYDGHPRGCPNCGLRIKGCPGGPDSKFFTKEFSAEVYFVGIVGDFGAYLKNREKQQSALGVYGSKEMKNKRWYQGTLNSWRSKWFEVVRREFPEIGKEGWVHFIENAEARGVDFGEVCRKLDVSVVRLNSERTDYKIVKPTFSTSPTVSFDSLESQKSPFVVENYFMPKISEVVSHFDRGGVIPMWRMALVAKKLHF